MKSSNPKGSAFTVVELVVIVTVVGVFATLLAPAFAQDNKAQTMAVRCFSNHAQLIKAWSMYAADSGDYVANNYTIPGPLSAINKCRTTGVCDAWALNVMVFTIGSRMDSTSTTNSALAKAGLLIGYHDQNIDVYRCPADTWK